jgi:hypothetical protein
VVPIKKGTTSQGADIWAAVDAQGPSQDMLPRYWSAAPNARPRIAARRKATKATIALDAIRKRVGSRSSSRSSCRPRVKGRRVGRPAPGTLAFVAINHDVESPLLAQPIHAGAALVAVKAVHTLAWVSIEAFTVYLHARNLRHPEGARHG